ncbi:MAG: winged helix-turn-helix domain-containing protein [Nocardioides sp.]
MLRAQDVRVDPTDRRAWRAEQELVLSRKEFDLLLALISRAGELVTREELMREVWLTTFWTSSKTIDVHLGWIRRKLGDDSKQPQLITTVRGKGLRFETAAPPGARLAGAGLTGTPALTAAPAAGGAPVARPPLTSGSTSAPRGAPTGQGPR